MTVGARSVEAGCPLRAWSAEHRWEAPSEPVPGTRHRGGSCSTADHEHHHRRAYRQGATAYASTADRALLTPRPSRPIRLTVTSIPFDDFIAHAACNRCGRPLDGAGEWTLETRYGVVVAVICPDCQTPEENAEAVIRDSTLDYLSTRDGRIIGRPKINRS